MSAKQPVKGTVPPHNHWLRIGGAVLLLGVSLFYFPINRSVSAGFTPDTALDTLIPLWPVWALPYLLAIGWWLAAVTWIFAKMELKPLRTVLIAFLLVVLSSYAVYLAFPTYVVRPDPTGTGWGANLIRWIYGSDQPYNALPSGHTYFTVIIMLILVDWNPRWRWLWISSVPVVILSTLFTKQHYILDVVCGILWAYGAFALAKKLSGWPFSKNRTPRRPVE